MNEKLSIKEKLVLILSVIILVILFLNFIISVSREIDYSYRMSEYSEVHESNSKKIDELCEKVQYLEDKIDELERMNRDGRNS